VTSSCSAMRSFRHVARLATARSARHRGSDPSLAGALPWGLFPLMASEGPRSVPPSRQLPVHPPGPPPEPPSLGGPSLGPLGVGRLCRSPVPRTARPLDGPSPLACLDAAAVHPGCSRGAPLPLGSGRPGRSSVRQGSVGGVGMSRLPRGPSGRRPSFGPWWASGAFRRGRLSSTPSAGWVVRGPSRPHPPEGLRERGARMDVPSGLGAASRKRDLFWTPTGVPLFPSLGL